MDIFTPVMIMAGVLTLMCVVPAAVNAIAESAANRRHKGWSR